MPRRPRSNARICEEPLGAHPLRGEQRRRGRLCPGHARRREGSYRVVRGAIIQGPRAPRRRLRGLGAAAAAGKAEEGRLVVEALPQARPRGRQCILQDVPHVHRRRHPRRDPGLRRAAFERAGPGVVRGRRRIHGAAAGAAAGRGLLCVCGAQRGPVSKGPRPVRVGNRRGALRRRLCGPASHSISWRFAPVARTHRRFRHFPQKAITQATRRPGI